MALDFPSSPTVGQQYGGYSYDGTKWKVTTTSTAPASIGPTPPASATNGDMWWNSTDGTQFMYYNDGSSAQWVESRSAIASAGYYSPNYIINGGFDIWQRGTSFNSFGSTSVYTADRFFAYRQTLASGLTVSRQASGLTAIQYCARIQRDSGNTSTAGTNLICDLESVTSIPLAGKTVTFSFYARAGANFSSASSQIAVAFATGTGTDQSIRSGYTGQVSAFPVFTISSSWQRFTYTTTIPSNATQIGFAFQNTPVGAAGANDYYEVTGVQLEEGSVATTFRRNANSLQGELAACQRYYWRLKGSNSYSLHSTALGNAGAGSVRGPLALHVPLRAFPTSVEWGGNIMTEGEGVNRVVTGIAIENNVTTPNTPVMTFSISGSNPTTGFYQVIGNNDSSAYIGISAEL